MKKILFTLIFANLACLVTAPFTPAPTSSALPVSDDGLFTGSAQDFLINEEEFRGLYTRGGLLYKPGDRDPACEISNADVIDGNDCFGKGSGNDPSRAAFIEATGRLSSWLIQFSRDDAADNSLPDFIVCEVIIYDNLDGPNLAISRKWNGHWWNLIDNGTMTQLPAFPGLDAEQLIIQYPNDGSITINIVYRNLLIRVFTSPNSSWINADPNGPVRAELGAYLYDYFAKLAKTHIEWIQSREQ